VTKGRPLRNGALYVGIASIALVGIMFWVSGRIKMHWGMDQNGAH